ncbi:MAG: ABC transporter substrate-binding protein [Oceanipulchritudo sp.]
MKQAGHILIYFAVLIATPLLAQSAGEMRLVTLGGPATEIVYALGSGDQIVAADSSSLYPEAAKALPKVGYVSAVGAEGLLSEEPALIIATSRFGPPAVVERIEASGIPLLTVESPHNEETLEEAIEEIGAVLGKEEVAAELWGRIAADLEAAKEKARASGAPPVVFLLGDSGSAMAAGRDTQGAGILSLAGGRNLFDDYTGYKPVSEEALLMADPAFIFIGDHGSIGDEDPQSRLESLGLGRLAAATGAEVRLLDLGKYLTFGPRTGEAALRLAELLSEGWE